MFFAACEGYFDKLDDTAALFRKLGLIVNRSAGGKDNIMEAWPLHNDEKQNKIEMWSEEEFKAINEKANKRFK